MLGAEDEPYHRAEGERARNVDEIEVLSDDRRSPLTRSPRGKHPRLVRESRIGQSGDGVGTLRYII
jgi:hypothetical protein